jgi:hypothetical protein
METALGPPRTSLWPEIAGPSAEAVPEQGHVGNRRAWSAITALSERIKPMARSMAVQARWPRIYRMLKAAGHDPAEAAEILLAAERKDDSALSLIKTVRASTMTCDF